MYGGARSGTGARAPGKGLQQDKFTPCTQGMFFRISGACVQHRFVYGGARSGTGARAPGKSARSRKRRATSKMLYLTLNHLYSECSMSGISPCEAIVIVLFRSWSTVLPRGAA